MCWVFRGKGEEDIRGKGEEDGGTVDGRVSFHQASGASLRGSTGATACVSGGAQYLMIVDDYSRMGWPYFLKRKSDVPMAFSGFLADIDAKGVPSMVECIRSDNGTEFTKPEFVALLNERGVRREYTSVDSPEYDGVVERPIAMALELTMAFRLEPPRLFGDAKMLPTQPLWAEECKYASDVINMTTRLRNKPDMHSPYRKFHGRPPFAPHLPFLKPGFSPRKEEPKVRAQGGGLFLPEWRKQPFRRFLQKFANVWAYAMRRYLGTPGEIVCGGTASGGEELSIATVAAAVVPRYAGASGRSQCMVRATATALAAAAATAVTTAAAAAAVTVAVTAAVIVTAAATATVAAAAVAAAAAAAVVTAVTAATATAATASKACCPEAG